MRRLPSIMAVFFLILARAGDAQSMLVRRTDIVRHGGVDAKALETARFLNHGTSDTLTKADSVRLRPGQYVIIPTGTVATRDSAPGPVRDKHVDLPVRVITVDPSGTQLLTLTIRVAAEGAGLVFDAATHRFSGLVLIGLEDSLRRNKKIELGTGGMDLQVTSNAGQVVPQNVSITHTNIPWDTVRVVALNPHDTVQLVIRAVFNPEGYAAPILVDRPSIDVRPASSNVQGLGLEATPVSVTIPMSLRGDTVTVTLWSDRGGLDAGTIRIPPSGTNEVGLRSSGIGRNTVHAEIAGVASGQAPVRFTLPWPFLVAAILGGVLGTLIRRRQRRQARADFVAGIVAGLVSAVAYAIGLNLTGINLNVRVGEAAVLVVAALGAGLELPGLTGLRKRLAAPSADPGAAPRGN